MKRVSRLAIVVLSVMVILLSTACLLTSGLTNILKKSTETPTVTVTNTPRPTSTPSPTATPTPQLPAGSALCAFGDDCPDVHNITEYLPTDYQDGIVNDVEIPFDQPVWFTNGWYTLDDATLENNMSKIEWIFSIDGVDFFQQDWLQSGIIPDAEDENILYPGYWYGVILSDWTIDDPHLVRIGFKIKEDLNDGWGDYYAGDTYVSSYYVKPVREVHLEPTATNTPIPQPTKTRAPEVVKPTNTKGPELPKDMTLRVQNNCAEKHTVIFDGPDRIKYPVEPSETLEYQVPHGTYTWTVDGDFGGGPQDLYTSVWMLTLCN